MKASLYFITQADTLMIALETLISDPDDYRHAHAMKTTQNPVNRAQRVHAQLNR